MQNRENMLTQHNCRKFYEFEQNYFLIQNKSIFILFFPRKFKPYNVETKLKLRIMLREQSAKVRQ